MLGAFNNFIYDGCMPNGEPKEGESLADLFPDVASQWHPTLNGDASPKTTSAGSHKKVWWMCDKGDDHQWNSSIKSRTFQRQWNCPFCVNQRVSSTNNLKVLYPEVASQWHTTKNGDLTPVNIIAGSPKKYWWKCDVAYDHEWETSIHNRTSKGSNCPYCHGREASSTNNLKDSFPEISSQWHPTNNGELTARDVTDTSGKKVWWKCDVADDHEWSSVIASRTARDGGCPFCSGKKVSLTNRLDLIYPEVAKQWHLTKNGDLEPDQFTWGSGKRVWWKCDVAADHEWRTTIASRTGGNNGCPSCSGLQISVTNSLQTRFPLVASEWHPTKNGDLTPDQVVAMTRRKVWWKCSAVEEHEWEADIANRTNVGSGCPLCVLTPRSAQEIRLAHELEALIDFDLEAHKLRLDKRTYDMDIIIESLRIVIEFDGAYWHRNKADKDLEKTKKLEAEGWNVIRVRESPLDSIHPNDVMVEVLAPVKEVADLVFKKIIEVTGGKIPKLKEYLASDQPWREKEALSAIREYQAENARKKAELAARRAAKKKP